MTENIKKLRQIYLTLLHVFDDVCKANGIPWYLWAGTLLGAIRHGGFIPWDDDVDVCVPYKYIDKLLSIKWPKGYTFGQYDPRNNKMYILCMNGTTMVNCKTNVSKKNIHRNGLAGVKLDIFPLYDTPDKSGKGIKRCTTIFDKKDHQLPVSCFGSGATVKFENSYFPIPQDYVTALKITYGEDYMTPKKYIANHKHFIDLYNGQDVYKKGYRKLPSKESFKPTDGEVMFAAR